MVNEIESTSYLDTGFIWDELAPLIRTSSIDPLPSIATLLSPSGRYVADHISATRNIAALLYNHFDNDGQLAATAPADVARRVSHLAHAAAIHFARAESAGLDAALWRISPGDCGTRDRARLFVEDKLAALEEVERQLERGSIVLDRLLRELGDSEGGGGQRPPTLREDTGAKTPPGEAKPDEKPGDKPKELAKDALDQAGEIKDAINALIKKFGKDEKKNVIVDAVEAVARAVVSGGKAALIGALTELIKQLDSDASAEDIDIDLDGDTVTIFFRIRRGCLVVLDFLFSDDFVFIRKSAKRKKFKFSTGKSAKEAHDKPQSDKETPAPAPK